MNTSPRPSDHRSPSAASAWHREGFGYTLATGRLFAPMDKFHEWAEALMSRPILTHDFADEALWDEMRERFEALFTEGVVEGVHTRT